MQKQGERLTHDRVYEHTIIIEFLRYKNIIEEPDFAKSYPDCIIPNASTVIEETSVRNFKVARIRNLYKNKREEVSELQLKYDNNLKNDELIAKIQKAIKKKDSQKNYLELLSYEKRILIVRINGICFDWNIFEKIANRSNFSALRLQIFNYVYLVLYPVTPTKSDIDNNNIPPMKPNFIQIF